MIRGGKPKPTALRRLEGNPGKRGYNHAEPVVPDGVPGCPEHLGDVAREEWHRLVLVLHKMGVVTLIDRAALAAYCQCYGRWVEAEERLKATPLLMKTPSGYVQQSPWLSVSNRQLELMGRFMSELGITPAARSRVAAYAIDAVEPVNKVEYTVVWKGEDGHMYERSLEKDAETTRHVPSASHPNSRLLDGDL